MSPRATSTTRLVVLLVVVVAVAAVAIAILYVIRVHDVGCESHVHSSGAFQRRRRRKQSSVVVIGRSCSQTIASVI